MYEGRLASRAAGASAVILQAHFLPLCLLSNGRAGVLKMPVLAGDGRIFMSDFYIMFKIYFYKNLINAFATGPLWNEHNFLRSIKEQGPQLTVL